MFICIRRYKDAKIAIVLLLDKGTSNKDDISNFLPVSILTTITKICEIVTKIFDR